MIRLDCYEYYYGFTDWYLNAQEHMTSGKIDFLDWTEFAECHGATIGWYADEDRYSDPKKSGMYFEFIDEKYATAFLLRWS